MNIELAIKDGINILKNKRIVSAKLDAEILMAKALKQDRKYIFLNTAVQEITPCCPELDLSNISPSPSIYWGKAF